jgi:hypothetical protein
MQSHPQKQSPKRSVSFAYYLLAAILESPTKNDQGEKQLTQNAVPVLRYRLIEAVNTFNSSVSLVIPVSSFAGNRNSFRSTDFLQEIKSLEDGVPMKGQYSLSV